MSVARPARVTNKRSFAPPAKTKMVNRATQMRLSAIAKKHSLSSAQKRQVEIVAEVKPDWTDDEIFAFCQKCRFNGDTISQGINNAFEDMLPSQDQTSESWNVIKKKDRKKKLTERQPDAEEIRTSDQSERRDGRRNRSQNEAFAKTGGESSNERRKPRGKPNKSTEIKATAEAFPTPSPFSPGAEVPAVVRPAIVPASQLAASGNKPTYAGLLKLSLERDAAMQRIRQTETVTTVIEETVTTDIASLVTVGEQESEVVSQDEADDVMNAVTLPNITTSHQETTQVVTLIEKTSVASSPVAPRKATQDLFLSSDPVILPEHVRVSQMDSTTIQFGNLMIGGRQSAPSFDTAAENVSVVAEAPGVPVQTQVEQTPLVQSNQQILQQQLADNAEEEQESSNAQGKSVAHPTEAYYESESMNVPSLGPQYNGYPAPVPSNGYPIMPSAVNSLMAHASYGVPYDAEHQPVGPRGVPAGYYDPYMQQAQLQAQRQARPSKNMSRNAPYNRSNGKNRRDRGSRPQSQGTDAVETGSDAQDDSKQHRNKRPSQQNVRHFQPHMAYAPSHGPIPASALPFGPSSAPGMYPYGSPYGVQQFYGQSQGYAAPPGFGRPTYGYHGAAPTNASHFPASYNTAAAPRGGYHVGPQSSYEDMHHSQERGSYAKNGSEQPTSQQGWDAEDVEESVKSDMKPSAVSDDQHSSLNDHMQESSGAAQWFDRREFNSATPSDDMPSSNYYIGSNGVYGQMQYQSYAPVLQQSYGEPIRSSHSSGQQLYGQWSQ